MAVPGTLWNGVNAWFMSFHASFPFIGAEASGGSSTSLITPDTFSSLHAGTEKVEEGEFQGRIGGQQMVGGAEMFTGLAHGRQVGLEFLQIFFASDVGVDVEVALGFDIQEQAGFAEIELKLGWVQHLEE